MSRGQGYSQRIFMESSLFGTSNVYQNDSEVCLRVPKMPHGNVRGPQRRSSGTPGAESLIIAESSSKIWSPPGPLGELFNASAPPP